MAAVAVPPAEVETRVQSTMQNDDYNKSSHNQLTAHKITYAALKSALQRLARRSTDAKFLEVCDLGSAGGANSVELMKVLLQELRGNLKEQRQLNITFEEQPDSDFNTLVQTVMKEESSLWKPNNVRVNFVAKSFYESLFPDQSVDLSLSYIALHWMSAPPRKAVAGSPDSVKNWIFCGEVGTPPEVFQAWREASMKDLVHFLRLRAEELRAGGEGLYLMAGGDTYQEWIYGPNPQDSLDLAERTGLPYPTPMEQRQRATPKPHVKGSGRCMLTEALMRSVAAGEVREVCLERAFAPVFMRTRADVLEALEIVNKETPGGLFELMELHDEKVPVGGQGASGANKGKLYELSWSIHANYLQATSGASDEEMKSIKRHLVEIHTKLLDEEVGASAGYMYLHVRRTENAA